MSVTSMSFMRDVGDQSDRAFIINFADFRAIRCCLVSCN
jgi:hypothetical protein